MRTHDFPQLYGKSSNGKIKLWSISVHENDDGTAYYEVISGYETGKKQVFITNIKEGKNIGKANETDPFTQAHSDARADWNKKVDGGYVKDKNNIADPADVQFFLPMLAHRFDKRGKNIKFPAMVQPKLDGLRILSKKENGKVTLWSRRGKVIDVPTLIQKELNTFMAEGTSVDGEIYVHGWDFQRIISAVKKKSDDTDKLEYHVYDVPSKTYTFERRFIGFAKKHFPNGGTEHVKIVPTYKIQDESEIPKRCAVFIKNGYEGLMVRNIDGLYKFGHRSADLQKVKSFDDDEFKIIGGREATGKDTGTVVFHCKTKDGKEFDVRPRGSWVIRKEYWDNLDSYINKKLTIRFQGYTLSGIPRFPVGLHIRPDWDK